MLELCSNNMHWSYKNIRVHRSFADVHRSNLIIDSPTVKLFQLLSSSEKNVVTHRVEKNDFNSYS